MTKIIRAGFKTMPRRSRKAAAVAHPKYYEVKCAMHDFSIAMTQLGQALQAELRERFGKEIEVRSAPFVKKRDDVMKAAGLTPGKNYEFRDATREIVELPGEPPRG